ncbi:MAG TPA: SDR family NAD(P)-dependent oxidoreductase, partial [Rhizomicrobium sp.]|nr:SDR family NAD(P)-dependent oxidoreductase [Rhizomicrobium sp.]
KANAVAHAAHMADLSLMSEQKRVAREIAAEPRIDVLINNAGAIFNRRAETKEGLERTFALNHMAYFTLTNLLLDRIKATPGARIISVSSGAHRRAQLDFDDLQTRRGYSGFGAYSKSKLCNILFTRALARRLEGTGVTANCLHPGFVATRFADEAGGLMQRLVGIGKTFGGISPEEGAKTIVYLASSPEVTDVSGEYFYQRRIDTPTPEARNDEHAERLWRVSGEIAAL